MLTVLRIILWGVGLWRLTLIVVAVLAWHEVRGQEPAATVAAVPEGRGPVTNLPLPRFVSLRSDEINVRRGPGRAYRRDWVYRRRGFPVMIVEEYGDWRRIVDADGTGGWVYHALVTGARTVLVTAAPDLTLREEPGAEAFPVAVAEPGVIARLEACLPDWCEIEAGGISGWVPKSGIWGVAPDEAFD